MIHQYKNNGYSIVLDVNSGSVHVVDDIVYDSIALLDKGEEDDSIVEQLKTVYPEADIRTALDEIRTLKEEGMLFTEDIYENAIEHFKGRPTVVKALCLHIAHDCNLACKYCFAEEGEYHGRRALMSYEVGKKALDFLIANSGSRRNLEVDFFGGEPLHKVLQIFIRAMGISLSNHCINHVFPQTLYGGESITDGTVGYGKSALPFIDIRWQNLNSHTSAGIDIFCDFFWICNH